MHSSVMHSSMMQRVRSAFAVRTRLRRLRWMASAYRIERQFVSRGRALAYARYHTGPTSVRTITAGGVTAGCRFGGGHTDRFVWREIFDLGEYDSVDLDNAAWILDIGGNVGYASLWFARRYPDARIVVVEPDLGNYELLVANVAHEPRIHPIRAAIAPAGAPRQRVVTGALGFGGATLETVPVDDAVTTELQDEDATIVDSIDVASILDRFGIERLDLLKIDVEGAEKAVFEHSAPWIDRVDAIVAEIHEYFVPGCGEVFRTATSAFDIRSSHADSTAGGGSRGEIGGYTSIEFVRRGPAVGAR